MRKDCGGGAAQSFPTLLVLVSRAAADIPKPIKLYMFSLGHAVFAGDVCVLGNMLEMGEGTGKQRFPELGSADHVFTDMHGRPSSCGPQETLDLAAAEADCLLQSVFWEGSPHQCASCASG